MTKRRDKNDIPYSYIKFVLCSESSKVPCGSEVCAWIAVEMWISIQRDKGVSFYSQAFPYLNKVIGCLMNVSCSAPCGQRGCCLMNCLMCLITVTMLNEEKAREIWKIHWRIRWKWIGSIGTFCSSLNSTLWAVLFKVENNAILWLVVFL